MKTIAWDVDDVLNDLMRRWLNDKWLKEHQRCKKTYEDLIENPPHKILGASKGAYLKSLDEYRLSGMYRRMSPVAEVAVWFDKYGKDYRHIALTAVPLAAAHVSAEWVFEHFGRWIRTFHFVPSKRKGADTPEFDENKADFLRWIEKVDLLVDDSLDNINKAGGAGVKTLVIPRPWNGEKTSLKDSLRQIRNINWESN